MSRVSVCFLLAVVFAVATACVAPAEVIYVEDFEDANGEPGFSDPFVHEIGSSPYLPPGFSWRFHSGDLEHGTIMYLLNAQDCVTFPLPSGNTVVYASVEYLFGGYGVIYSIDFIGQNGSQRVLLPWSTEWLTVEVSSSEIGPIQEIQMRGSEIAVDNITIHVVPEPSLAILGTVCLLVVVSGRKSHGVSARVMQESWGQSLVSD